MYYMEGEGGAQRLYIGLMEGQKEQSPTADCSCRHIISFLFLEVMLSG